MQRNRLAVGLFSFLSSASGQTHLGVSTENLVTLEMRSDVRGGCGDAKIEFVRTFPDGRSSGPFRVPEGKTLVVTDMDWHYFSGQPHSLIALTIFVEALADAESRQRAAESAD